MTAAGIISGLMIAAAFWIGFVLGARAERRNEAARTAQMLNEAARDYRA
jgi:hypothetical protein